MIQCTAIIIKTLSDNAYDRFFNFLYENKIPTVCHDTSKTIEIRGKDIEKIEINETIVFISQMGDTLELDPDEFYKIEVI